VVVRRGRGLRGGGEGEEREDVEARRHAVGMTVLEGRESL
jgi:hypothetical protein